MMLVVSNPDTAAAVAKVGLDPARQKYYLFGKQNQILANDTLTATTVSRFLSVDPLAKTYPWYTPYQFAGNTPIQAIDLDGLEPVYGQHIYNGYRVEDADEDGKVTNKEKTAYTQSLAIWGAVALDSYIFRGWLTRTYLAHELGSGISLGEKASSARKQGDTQAAEAYSTELRQSKRIHNSALEWRQWALHV